jgi:type IV pilus assembly protein PilW
MRNSRGFSMVELMVAITLALVVTAAVVSVFVGSRAAYQSTSGTAAATDGGRFALSFIQESARGAGYMACASGFIDAVQPTTNQLAYDFQHGVMGFEAVGSTPASAIALPATQVAGAGAGSWLADADATVAPVTDFTGASANQVSNSDVLVLRSSLPRATPVYLTLGNNVGDSTVAVSSDGGMQPGQIAAVSDCSQAVTFQIASVPAGTPTNITLAAAGNGAATLNSQFPVGAQVMPLTTSVYYIGQGMDGDTALRRLDLNGVQNGPGVFSDEELVPDIENMQVLYGIAAAGTTTPTQYVTADQVTDFNTVVAIKIAVLAASPPSGKQVAPAQPYNLLGTQVTVPQDTRTRKVFDITINLRDSAT